MNTYGIRFVAHAWLGMPPPWRDEIHAGAWLAHFDLDARDGIGEVTWTMNSEDALAFPTPGVALAAYRSTSKVRPLRDDGQPNRPLTAFTVSVEALPDAPQINPESRTDFRA